MKAVSSFRTRRRAADSAGSSSSATPAAAAAAAAAGAPATLAPPTSTPTTSTPGADDDSPPGLRRRACTSGASVDAAAFLSPPLTSADAQQQQRAWTVVPRKLRGLHPSPVIVYVRENPAVVTAAMDKLYATLVSTYNVDSREIRVANVPTAYDLPAAVRRMGKDKHMVVVVGLLTRDSVWFDQAQVDRVRAFLVSWSQDACVPLVDGILVGDDEAGLMQRVCAPRWSVVDGNGLRSLWLDAGAAAEQPTEHMFGHYLAHRAMEMFYIEHRGW
ncbi:hypothetical protein LPJ53_003665 [Coemansia erecta]|uniref:6,7-dimethyl-8-ribityllumazine synthase n=1 Tax=Coemansia erecta TaxID=147472 RepID=A0A9W7Y1J2_9FUNG|nr:hypothetical protein LPJ53_003665 [Coemansia erecta]